MRFNKIARQTFVIETEEFDSLWQPEPLSPHREHSCRDSLFVR